MGLLLLIAREFELVTRVLTGNVEVQVYLNDPADPGTVTRLTEKLQQVPCRGERRVLEQGALL